MIELKVGQILKSYKEVCEILDVKPTNGKGKKSHIKDFERYCTYHKQGNKFIIDEVFETPKPKIDGRSEGNNTNEKYSSQYNISKELNDKVGVYKIQLGNKIYIGSTISGFRKRFLQHSSP